MDMTTYFIVVGGLTTIWLIYKVARFLLTLGGWMFEAAFRNRFPNDFEMNLSWITQKLRDLGYNEVSTIDPGSERPGFLFRKSKTGSEIEVRLNAPLISSKDNSVVVVNHSNHTAIVMPYSSSYDNQKLLEKFCELLKS
jgi:hypothetical protein